MNCVLSIIRFKREKGLIQLKARGLGRLAGLLAPVVLLGMASICLAQGDAWTTKANMPTARDPVTSVVDGKIYAFGGSNNSPPYLGFSKVEEYEPATDTWTTKTNMPTARFGSSASTVNGKIYVIGGSESGSGTLYSTVEEYDPATDTWATKADMPTARMWLATSVANGKIYAIGGEQRIHGGVLSTVEEYNPNTNTWTTKANMPTVRYGLSTSVVNGKIYAIGGSRSIVEEYDPVTDTWKTKSNMPTARRWLSSSMVNDIIFAIGGLGSGGSTYGTVEAYDPATDTWTTKTAMPTRRFLLSTSVVSGKIYVIGGIPWPNAAPLSTVGEYDPGVATSVEGYGAEVPTSIELHQNYPNPFNPETTIQYQMPKRSEVKLTIFSLLGQRVATLVDEVQSMGVYSVQWDGKDDTGNKVASGVYLYRLQTEQFVQVKKLALMR